jgi:ABC-type glutathione transport system ATPase component
MAQRVMIATALSCRPALLIADEPTTALDVTVQAQLLELIKALQAELGMGVLFITHNLGVAAEIADRIAVMYAGRVVEEGPAEAIFAAQRMPYTAGLLASVPRLVLDDREMRLSAFPERSRTRVTSLRAVHSTRAVDTPSAAYATQPSRHWSLAALPTQCATYGGKRSPSPCGRRLGGGGRRAKYRTVTCEGQRPHAVCSTMPSSKYLVLPPDAA